MIVIINTLKYGRKQEPKMLFDVHLASSEQSRKRKFVLRLKNRVTSSENVNPFTVATSSGMSVHVLCIISTSECATWL